MLQMLALVLTSVFFALIIGIPVGIWGSQQATARKIINPLLDLNANDAGIRLFTASYILL